MSLEIQTGQTILFIGDSITDCARRNTERPLGNGYVRIFADLLTIREPEKKVNIINKGIGGDTVPGLQQRWTDDVLFHQPDWLSIKIGINDLHRTLMGNAEPVPPARFHDVYDEILQRTRVELPACQILLIDPFMISREFNPNSFRKSVLDLLPEYLAVVDTMSRKYQTRILHTHAMFQKLLQYHAGDCFCPEPVHPNPTGHLAIAEAIYQLLSR